MLIALIRPVSPSIVRCALTHVQRISIDLERARFQHASYARALEELGCRVIELPAEPGMPDAVFVEDTAVVLDEVAIMARPGLSARRSEVPSVEASLRDHRPIARIEPPATLDGGDVAIVGRTILVGLSTRTDAGAAEQLRAIAAPLGYQVRAVAVHGCLHLKSACTAVAPDTCLVSPGSIDAGDLDGIGTIHVDPAEPDAANALPIGGTVLHPQRFPRTRERLEARGIDVRPIDASELAKAEGGLTCCSIILEE